MNRSKNSLFIALFLLLALNSCKVLREAGLGKKEKLDTPAAILSSLERQQLRPEWFAARARISYADEDMSVTGSATIRMKTDSLLWVSVKKLGFEVARTLITKDSVFIIDRINNEYGAFDLAYLQESYNLPASFPIVQSLILGNPYFLNPESVILVEKKPNLQLRDRQSDRWIDYYLDPKVLRLLRMDYAETFGDQSLVASFEEYEFLGNKKEFAFFRNFNLNSSTTGATEMSIKFSQIELDEPQSIPFSVPRRYSRMGE
ncbi:MAG TPA: DUF4292 domain-containing protein [Saprospiraceae bacterium]|nr:DUF4292 domain-containing protein [Saprospiraceae bacterium]